MDRCPEGFSSDGVDGSSPEGAVEVGVAVDRYRYAAKEAVAVCELIMYGETLFGEGCTKGEVVDVVFGVDVL
mgnify:CR=1 FL=1